MKAETVIKTKWYQSKLAIISLLIFVFPVGAYLMWRYSNWSKQKKIIIGLATGLALIGLYAIGVNAPPTLKIDDIKGDNARLEIRDSTYKITGEVVGANSSSELTVNGEKVAISDNYKFDTTVKLQEGDNTIKVVVTKGSKSVEKSFVVHRETTQEAAKRKTDEESKAKLAADEAAKKQAENKQNKKEEAKPAAQTKTTYQKVNELIKSESDEYDATLFNGDKVAYDDSVAPPYEVIINTKSLTPFDCSGAKRGAYEVMKKLYTDGATKDKISRVRIVMLKRFTISLGSTDGLGLTNDNSWSGSTNFYKTYNDFKGENEAPEMKNRTWIAYEGDCK